MRCLPPIRSGSRLPRSHTYRGGRVPPFRVARKGKIVHYLSLTKRSDSVLNSMDTENDAHRTCAEQSFTIVESKRLQRLPIPIAKFRRFVSRENLVSSRSPDACGRFYNQFENSRGLFRLFQGGGPISLISSLESQIDKTASPASGLPDETASATMRRLRDTSELMRLKSYLTIVTRTESLHTSGVRRFSLLLVQYTVASFCKRKILPDAPVASRPDTRAASAVRPRRFFQNRIRRHPATEYALSLRKSTKAYH